MVCDCCRNPTLAGERFQQRSQRRCFELLTNIFVYLQFATCGLCFGSRGLLDCFLSEVTCKETMWKCMESYNNDYGDQKNRNAFFREMKCMLIDRSGDISGLEHMYTPDYIHCQPGCIPRVIYMSLGNWPIY